MLDDLIELEGICCAGYKYVSTCMPQGLGMNVKMVSVIYDVFGG
jgi:hypothetical protein